LTSLTHARWLNEPPHWALDGEKLTVTTGKDTDFWQNTFYDFIHDDGHFHFVEAEGDFTASIRFDGRYETLYDQAGLMVRLDDANWIKLGIEYSDGECNFSLVCTNNARSDWSVIPVGILSGPQEVRITRIGDAAIAHYRKPDGAWQMMRLCPFTAAAKVKVGPMTCPSVRASPLILMPSA
jgi:regulation of enolase protein 1 (concanavalin A-like superfamily)